MSNSVTVDGLSFECHGIVGVTDRWDVGGGVVVRHPAGGPFIVIDDHGFAEPNGARKPAPASGRTTAGLIYQPPIDCRALFFDNDTGTKRTYGMEGACVDLDVDLGAHQWLCFDWKFICDDGSGVANNNFALGLAYGGTVPGPADAPSVDVILASHPSAPPLLNGAERVPEDGPTMRLAEGQTTTPPGSRFFRPDKWRTDRWPKHDNGFTGRVRWIVTSGWDVSQPGNVSQDDKRRPSEDDREMLIRQRAFPATLLLSSVRVVTGN